MKRIGIIGGLGPEATIDYYQRIISHFKKINKNNNLDYPEIVIYSVNMHIFISYMQKKQYTEASNYIIEKIKALENAGVDFVAISANTPHQLFNDIKSNVNLPLISIVEATATYAQTLNLRRLGLFGTLFTMNAHFYADVLQHYHIEIIVPDENQKKYINEKLFNEIELGIFNDETRQGLIEIIKSMKVKNHIDGLILGCTELPLILTEPVYEGIPMLNTTELHVKAIVDYCLKIS